MSRGTVPGWAQKIIDEVAEEQGWGWVNVTWLRSRRHPWASSGRAWPRERKINIMAGQELTEAKVVLLHELAHLITPTHKHDDRFWDAMLILCRRYGVVKAGLARSSNSLARARRRALAKERQSAA